MIEKMLDMSWIWNQEERFLIEGNFIVKFMNKEINTVSLLESIC